MLSKIKTKFYEYICSLGYSCSDNGTYEEKFPWLMLRFQDAHVLSSHDLAMSEARIILDIFSTYNGEKEILDILDNINKHLKEFIAANNFIQYAAMRSLRIIGDKETGPVRKHGIATFSFVLVEGDEEDGE